MQAAPAVEEALAARVHGAAAALPEPDVRSLGGVSADGIAADGDAEAVQGLRRAPIAPVLAQRRLSAGVVVLAFEHRWHAIELGSGARAV